MPDQTRLVAFIPVRGGSKSIPLKNIKRIAGKPLVQWVLEAASNASCIDEIFVATDSDKIRSVVQAMGLPKVRVIGRSTKTATDEASTESVLLEFCESHNCSHVYLIQATSPLVTGHDIQSAWEFYNHSDYDSLLSVVRQKRFLWQVVDGVSRPLNYDPQSRPRRQDFDGYLVENGAFYLSSREEVLRSQCRISGSIGCYEMPEESYFELDEASDWLIVERLLQSRFKAGTPSFKNIRMLVMDCDGVMTDAGMYYSEDGEALKKFNTRDGKAIELLKQAGLKTAIITGEETPFVERRAEKLDIDYVILGASDKRKELLRLSERAGIPCEQIAYLGDDLNDLPAIDLCAISACPANAVMAVKNAVHIVLDAKGGEGAVRAFADMILG